MRSTHHEEQQFVASVALVLLLVDPLDDVLMASLKASLKASLRHNLGQCVLQVLDPDPGVDLRVEWDRRTRG